MSPAIWLAMARDDLRAAELLQEHGLPPLSRMHADHAVEKALRAFHLHRERQADEGSAGSEPRSPFPSPSPGALPWAGDAPRGPGGNRSRQVGVQPLASSLGEDTGWIAAALASLSLRAEHRQPVSEDADAVLAREAVQVAHEVLDRITERVYGDS